MIFQEKSDDIWTVKLMNFFCNVISHAMSGSVGTLSFVIPGLKIRIKGLYCLVPASRTWALVLWRARSWGSPAFFIVVLPSRSGIMCFVLTPVSLLYSSYLFAFFCLFSSASCPAYSFLFLTFPSYLFSKSLHVPWSHCSFIIWCQF